MTNWEAVRVAMWGNLDITERVHATQKCHQMSAAEILKMKQAEKLIEESGKGTCTYCGDEILKNILGAWESEFLLEFCEHGWSKKHKPKVKWTSEEGVVNA